MPFLKSLFDKFVLYMADLMEDLESKAFDEIEKMEDRVGKKVGKDLRDKVNKNTEEFKKQPEGMDFAYDVKGLNFLGKQIASWRERKGFVTGWLNMAEKLLLVHTEVSEATEALRKDDKKNFAEEIADAFIRLFDICGSLGIDIEKAIYDKMQANEQREYKHGKRF